MAAPRRIRRSLTVSIIVAATLPGMGMFLPMSPGTLSASLRAAQRGAAATHRQDLVGKPFDAVVVRVADGDTLDATPVGEARPVRIRLEGVDAPELGEVFSRDAQNFLRTLVFDRRVRVEGRELDRYGRLVARVFGPGGDVSLELLRAGLACHAYAPDARLAREESDARRRGVGFWAAETKPRCVERTSLGTPRSGAATARTSRNRAAARSAPRDAAAVAAGFRGNTRSGLYHASTCPNANCRNCTRLFTTEAEARAAGFKPAGDCLE